MNYPEFGHERITSMAAGELRDVVQALDHGDRAAAAGLAAIEPASWQAIERWLDAVGGGLHELLVEATVTDITERTFRA